MPKQSHMATQRAGTLAASISVRLCVGLAVMWLLLLVRPVAGDCYWPDGSENDGHDPCYTPGRGQLGLCCRSGDVCLDDGVCLRAASASTTANSTASPVSSSYYRGSCIVPD